MTYPVIPPAVANAIAEQRKLPPHRLGYMEVTSGEGLPKSMLLDKGRGPFIIFTNYQEVDVLDVWEEGNGQVIRLWTIRDRIVYYRDGSFAGRETTEYFSYAPHPDFPSDICPYCGADNGQDSSSRCGFDCYMCGGN